MLLWGLSLSSALAVEFQGFMCPKFLSPQVEEWQETLHRLNSFFPLAPEYSNRVGTPGFPRDFVQSKLNFLLRAGRGPVPSPERIAEALGQDPLSGLALMARRFIAFAHREIPTGRQDPVELLDQMLQVALDLFREHGITARRDELLGHEWGPWDAIEVYDPRGRAIYTYCPSLIYMRITEEEFPERKMLLDSLRKLIPKKSFLRSRALKKAFEKAKAQVRTQLREEYRRHLDDTLPAQTLRGRLNRAARRNEGAQMRISESDNGTLEIQHHNDWEWIPVSPSLP